ncbi:MIP family protein [Knoellia sinensis KCTC 19936]|uniref:MIP family protein n=1 Tax=Knoellia sinensis KCTC 19936 TaxID=1385520 RepID=A0A0A0IZP6_9MICO|nr:MIP/aquaporin family protein [Knoellia sinensis]KGN30650.1 MIP family protein [Knoellia sinensis KCTC 19936]
MTPLPRALAAEAVGTAGLLAAIVGSGIMAERLTHDVGLQLLANAVATVAALAVLIAVIAPVSGAHFNPAVSLAQAVRRDLPWSHFPGYAVAQVAGGVLGVALANLMYELAPLHFSDKPRTGVGQWVGEIVATAGLVLVVGHVSRGGRGDRAPWLVAAWILAAYWFTSSTSFANPAVTIARMFSDTFAGITPAHVLPFLAAQVTGVGFGLAGIHLFVLEPRLEPKEQS